MTVKVGEVTIIDDLNGLSSVEIQCNDGTIIKAKWKRNSANDFGYDVDEPVVNRTTNRLALMIVVRSVIANYLKGNYS